MAANQSFIATLREQLSLDYATGEHLNVVSSNLGMHRPPFGFSDDEWRAAVKEIALQLKLVRSKFYGVTSLLYGPYNNVTTSLREDASVGDYVLKVHSTAGLPQLGTVVIEHSQSSYDILEYRFINRATNEIFLVDPVSAHHYASQVPAVTLPVLAYDRVRNKVILAKDIGLPDSGFPLSFLLGGDDVIVSSISGSVASLVIPPTTIVRDTAYPSSRLTTTARDYGAFSGVLLPVADQFRFSIGSLVRVTDSTQTVTATGGTSSSVSVAGPLGIQSLVGALVTFSGNITPALAGISRWVSGNTATGIDLHAWLPDLPAPGDTFTVSVVREVVGIEEDGLSIILDRPITETSLSAGSLVEEVISFEQFSYAQVLVRAGGWDVFEAEKGIVDLLLPTEVGDNTTLTASYIHPFALIPTPSTTTTAAVGASALEIPVVSTADFPLTGVVLLDSETIGYYVKDATTLACSTSAIAVPHVSGTAVTLQGVIYPASNTYSGDAYVYPEAYHGPYVYSPEESYAAGASIGIGTLTSSVPYPTKVASYATLGSATLEVHDTTLWPLSATPFSVRVGYGTGNLEEVEVLEVARRGSCAAVLSASSSVGATVLLISSTGSGPGSVFPSSGFRVMLDKGTPSQEIAYVVESTPSTFTVASPLVYTHIIGASVELCADVLTVNPLGDIHVGTEGISERDTSTSGSSYYIDIPGNLAEEVVVLTSTLTLLAPGTLPAEGGDIVLNFGKSDTVGSALITVSASAGSTSITAAHSFQGTDFSVVLSPGRSVEETVHVTSVGFNLLNLANPLKYAHPAGHSVELRFGATEIVSYTSVSGTTVNLTGPTAFSSHHQPFESVILSSNSTPPIDGTGYALKLPASSREKLALLLELVRAAGVQVRFITRR